MQTVTVASVLALLASAAAGAPLVSEVVRDAVETLRSEVRVPSPNLDEASRSTGGVLDPSISWRPPSGGMFTATVQADKYFVAIGDDADMDGRDDSSLYVSGVEAAADAATFLFIPRASYPTAYGLKVMANSLSSEPRGWYLGVSREYPDDTDDDGCVRVVADGDRTADLTLWSVVDHPTSFRHVALVVAKTGDASADDVKGWYLAAPDEERDSDSVYLAVTDDWRKAAKVTVNDRKSEDE